jgi:hypothetical protein
MGITGRWVEAHMGKRMLGEILMDRDVINESQLLAVLTIARERGQLLGEVLIDMGLASHFQIEAALAEQRKYKS